MKKFLSRIVLGVGLFSFLSSYLPAASLTPLSTMPPAVSTAVPTVLATSIPTLIATTVPTVSGQMIVPTIVATPVVTVSASPKVSASLEPASLSEVVVTANRVKADPNAVTSSETILDNQELEKKQSGTVKDALVQVPGVNVTQNGNPGETSGVYLRGANPELTLVLMDGIPLNDPVGSPFDYEYLDGLSLDDVEQIEVVRGPESTLWGSNAIGGVINIIPKSGPAPLGGSVLVEGGSYNTTHEAVSAQGGDNGGYFNFNASHFGTAGFPALDVRGLDATDKANLNSSTDTNPGTINNGDDNNTVSLRLGSNLTSNLEEKVFARYSQSNTSFDDQPVNVLVDDPTAFALQKQFMVDSHTDWKLLNGFWDQTLTFAFYDDNRAYNVTANPYDSNAWQATYDSQVGQVVWQNNLHFAKEETLVLGVQGQDEWAVSTYGGASSLPVTNVTTVSGFAESETNIEDRLFFNLGGRWEDQSQYGVHTTYQAGLAYILPGIDTKLKANYGTGFLAPTLYQLFNPSSFALGNPNLQPETSSGFDLGFEQPIAGKDFLTLGANYFDNDLTNLIQYQNSTYTNIGQARTYGVESFLEFRGIKNLDLKGGYTYTYAWNVSNDTELLRRPQNKVNGDADYQLDKLGFGASVIYTSSALDNDFEYPANIVTLPSYWLVNLRASYQVNPQVKVFARVDNLFNQWYETAYGYSTPGLSAYGGTKISF